MAFVTSFGTTFPWKYSFPKCYRTVWFPASAACVYQSNVSSALGGAFPDRIWIGRSQLQRIDETNAQLLHHPIVHQDHSAMLCPGDVQL